MRQKLLNHTIEAIKIESKDTVKNIIILSAEMGQGHMSAAKAVKEGIERLYGDRYNVEIIDFMAFLSKRIHRVSKKTYERVAQSAPILCDLVFKTWDRKWQMKLLNKLNYPIAYRKLKKFFHEKQPDLIISTFPVWDHLAREAFRKYNKNLKFISVITDSINIHNAWTLADMDYQIVANKETANAVKKLGVKENKIKTLGFPVRLDFLEPKNNRDEFLKEHSLDPNKFTILFLPVSQRHRKNIKILQELTKNESDCNIIVISGRDRKIKEKLEGYKFPKNVKLLGWTDHMADYIKASDVVITKAGGATVMECIAAKKPLIITAMIARHESGNAEVVKSYRLGIMAYSRDANIPECIDQIRKFYPRYQKNLAKISNPAAALKIAKFVVSKM